MECAGSIYKITNLINGKIYIGKTKFSISKRWRMHVSASNNLNNSAHLQNAIRKYGNTAFKIESLCSVFKKEDLNYFESFFIKNYKSTDPVVGYNHTTGGDGHYEWSIDTIQKRAAKRKGQRFNKEQLKRLSLSHIGQIPWNRKPIISIKEGKIVEFYESITAAHKKGFFQQYINLCLKGRKTKYKGYTWQYVI